MRCAGGRGEGDERTLVCVVCARARGGERRGGREGGGVTERGAAGRERSVWWDSGRGVKRRAAPPHSNFLSSPRDRTNDTILPVLGPR